MKKTLALFIMAAVLAGCKGSESLANKNNGGSENGLGGLIVPGERTYNESELKIGRRICAALKNKRELFERMVDLTQQIQMRGEARNCDQGIFNNSDFVVKLSNASSTDLQYIATNRSTYLNDVITDQNGAMKSLCSNLAVSDTVSNTSLNGSSYLIVNLLISSGFDRIEISKKTKDAAGNYPLVSMEGVNVATMASQINPKFFGAEQERIRYVACPGSKNSSYIKQSWLNPLTSF